MLIYISIQRYVTIHVDKDYFLPTINFSALQLQMLLGNANGRRRTIEKRGILVTSLTLRLNKIFHKKWIHINTFFAQCWLTTRIMDKDIRWRKGSVTAPDNRRSVMQTVLPMYSDVALRAQHVFLQAVSAANDCLFNMAQLAKALRDPSCFQHGFKKLGFSISPSFSR